MNRRTLIALLVVGVAVLALVFALIARPLHWERTAGLAVVLGVVAAGIAYRTTRIA